MVKGPPANPGDGRDTGLIPGSGRSPGGGHGNLLQCSCLEDPMDRGAWQAAVHRVTKSRTQLKRLSTVCACRCVGSVSLESPDGYTDGPSVLRCVRLLATA